MISFVPSRIWCTLKSRTYFSMPYSFRQPYPPCICKEQSQMPEQSSVATFLAMAEQTVLLGSLESTNWAALRTIREYRELTRSEAISAYLNCRYWNSDNFLPNCFLVLIYFFAAQRQKAAPPKLQLAMLILPPSKAFMAILKPSPSLPMRLAAGTRTLSKLTKAVGWLVQPIFSSFLPNSTPLASPGTMKADTSLAEVLAITMQILLKLPPEMNIFDPEITYSSPSFLANDFIERESDPESGSVRQQLEKSCMVIRPGRNFYCCFSLPNQSIIQQHMLWIVRQAAVGTHPVERAQKMIEASSLLKPVPFLQQIAEKPISAASLKVQTGKQASFSQSRAQGLIFFLAKSRAWLRRSSKSSPMELSSNLQIPSQI